MGQRIEIGEWQSREVHEHDAFPQSRRPRPRDRVGDGESGPGEESGSGKRQTKVLFKNPQKMTPSTKSVKAQVKTKTQGGNTALNCQSIPVGLGRLLPLLDDDGHWGGRGEHGGRSGYDRRGTLHCDHLGLSHELCGLGHELGRLSYELRLLKKALQGE